MYVCACKNNKEDIMNLRWTQGYPGEVGVRRKDVEVNTIVMYKTLKQIVKIKFTKKKENERQEYPLSCLPCHTIGVICITILS